MNGSLTKDEGAQVADETRFQLIAKGEKCVVLESVKEYEKCVGVREDGTLMPASHCSAVDEHAKFYVYLLVSFFFMIKRIFKSATFNM